MSAAPQTQKLPFDDTLRRALQFAADGVAGVSGEDIFQYLTNHLALALNVDYALIGLLTGDDSRTVRVIAMTADGKPVESFEYSLAGTPCEQVVGSNYRHYPDRVQLLFSDPHPKELKAEGYAGISLFGSDGRVLGIMAILDRQPMQNAAITEQLLRIFSVRAAAELERLQASHAAQTEADQYRAIFNASVVGFMLFNEQGRVVDANPAFKRMHGYAPDHDFRGIDPFEFIPEQGHDVYHQFMQSVQEHGRFHMEGLGRRTDGTIITVDVNGVRMDYQGRPHMLAIVRDITKDKLADQQLQVREEQYRVTFNASSDGMALWTMDGKLVDVNQACCNLHGMTREQLLKAPLTDYVPPESMPKLMKLLETVRDGRVFQDEAIATHKNGEVFRLDMRGLPATFQDERHVLLVLRDITEAKKNEEALRASEERYHTIFNASVDGLALCTPDGRIMEANPAFCRLHGYTREELLAAESFQFVHPDSQLRCWAFFEAASAGHSLESEAIAQRKDGTLFDAEVHGVPVHYGDEPHLLVIMRDITERKQAETERSRLEAQLRQSQKMEAIGHLTGGIAHDFNNILTGIMGYIVMAQEWEQQHRDAKLNRYLERIQNSATRARDLIQQMLTFSRGQRGEPRPLQPAPLIKECVKLLESMLPSTVQTRLNFSDSLPTVLADPVCLEQVLLNLCINARDAMSGSGILEIGLRQIECTSPCTCASCRKPITGRFLELSVGDTGSGISREVLERIFEPFFTTKEAGKGSGMGLATVHGIVHEYGGHIHVDSEPGKGARFSVLLPLSEVAASDCSTAGECLPASKSDQTLYGEVLLVEDDPDVREFMVERLQDWGLTVHASASGPEALQQISERNRPFHFYLFDYTMPGMTGIELARELRSIYPDSRPVLYTGYGEELSPVELAGAGIRDVLRKPVELDALHGLIKQVLAEHP